MIYISINRQIQIHFVRINVMCKSFSLFNREVKSEEGKERKEKHRWRREKFIDYLFIKRLNNYQLINNPHTKNIAITQNKYIFTLKKIVEYYNIKTEIEMIIISKRQYIIGRRKKI